MTMSSTRLQESPSPAPLERPEQLEEWRKMHQLLAVRPRASELRRIAPRPAADLVRIRCVRSLPFEFVSELMDPFMGLWGARHQVTVSDYDPALPGLLERVSEDQAAPHLHVVWVDWRLHSASQSGEQAAGWLASLIGQARAAGLLKQPVLINNWVPGHGPGNPSSEWVLALNEALARGAEGLPDVHLVRLDTLTAELGEGELFDPRNDSISHFPFSGAATVTIARLLGAGVMPAVLRPRLKAIALDLDDTLYAGVLGEDGAEGVELSAGHAALQRFLAEQRRAGILLALCSRNERADAEALFAQRADFPLKWSDFASVQVNWEPKARNLRRIAADLNIDPSAILFVDDNPAELSKAVGELPTVPVVLAAPGGSDTAAVLSRHPGLFRVRRDETAELRTRDIQANRMREQMREQAGDLNTYLAGLKMVVDLHENAQTHVGRLHELSQKTNQFNLALARMSEQAAQQAVEPGALTVTISLKDALADSGIVGALVLSLEEKKATVQEFLMSCRALGRDVEVLAFRHALRQLAARGVERLTITYREGPRNQPALDFLRRFVDGDLHELELAPLLERVERVCKDHPAELIIHS